MDVDSCPVTLDVEGLLIDIVKAGGGARPAEDPPGIFGLHVHAAVAHREPEVIMPICAVQSYALACKKTGPRNSGQNDVVCITAGGCAHSS